MCVLTGPGIKPRRVPLGGLDASSRHDLDRHASGGICLAWGLVERLETLEAGLRFFWVMERKFICSLGVLLARDYRTQGNG